MYPYGESIRVPYDGTRTCTCVLYPYFDAICDLSVLGIRMYLMADWQL